jgi:hypothetical protein
VAQIDGLAVRTLLAHKSIPRERAFHLLVEQLERDLGVSFGLDDAPVLDPD